jgi:DNA-binding transcriptional regulator PaaX
MTKYKYYLKKPKSEIVKDILTALLISGAVVVAASSPYFIRNLMRGLKQFKRYGNKKVQDNFYKLKKQGLIKTEIKKGGMRISLTDKGKKKAGWMQIDELKINKPKKWDKKWRLVMFDIAHLKKTHRDAFRGKLKELGFQLIQKSIWIHPFDCRDEINLLKDFFGLTENEIRLIVADKIGEDRALREIFKIN